ncbi:MAG: Stf0 family sulfotransferase [Caulobacteraceae bacterium]
MTDRLSVFADARVDEIRGRMEEVGPGPWPSVEGALVVLFTARSGSTFLCREIESDFDVGRMGETLNPAQVKGRPAGEVVARHKGRWFAFKAGLQGVIAAELHGFFDAYLDRCVFILLARRDIVAQAVSLEKAAQTKQWHTINEAQRTAAYDGAKIAAAVKTLASRLDQLRAYARASGRPWRTLIYEDFSNGDFSAAEATCEALGVPRRAAGEEIKARPVERVGDAVNEAWAARFRAEMDAATATLIEEYQAGL